MEPKKRKLDVKCSPGTFRNIEADEVYRNNITSQLLESDDFDEIIFMPNDQVQPSTSLSTVCEEEENKKNVWVDAAVKLLLSLLKELRPRVGKSLNLKNKKQMWQKINEKLYDEGYTFSATQVEAKYFALERQYKKVSLNNNKTGRSRQTCPYQSELDDILKEKVALSPEFVLDSEADVSLDNTSVQDLQEDLDVSKSDVEPSTSKRKKSAQDKFIENANKNAEQRNKNDEMIRKLLEDNLKKKEERAERKDAIEKKKLELLERLINCLEK